MRCTQRWLPVSVMVAWGLLALTAQAADSKAAPAQGAQQAALGVYMSETGGHVQVIGVAPGSPAAQAGIRVGDELRKVNDEGIKTARGMTGEIGEFEPGDHVSVTIARGGTEHKLDATLGARSTVFAPQQASRGRAAYSMVPNAAPQAPAARMYSVAPRYNLSPGTGSWLDRTDLRRSTGARGWSRDHGPRETIFGTVAPEN